ncbi:MAG: ABC transporter ATP-binding protein [bacterium]
MNSPDPIVSVEGVSFRYGGGEEVLRNVSLEVGSGVFLGLLGPNGGGKTTLVRLLLGQLRPLRGRIRVLGRPAHDLGDRRLQIGYVPQRSRAERAFPATVRDVVLMGAISQAGLGRRMGEEARRRSAQLIERVGLAPAADRTISEVSGGEIQRAYIARALMPRPRLLILDEPTSEVDAPGKEQIVALLQDLRRELDLTLMMVSHDVALIASAASRIACLDGELHFHDWTERLTDEALRRAYRCDFAAAAAFGGEGGAPGAGGHARHGHSHEGPTGGAGGTDGVRGAGGTNGEEG